MHRALYNGMDQGYSATTLECEGATRSSSVAKASFYIVHVAPNWPEILVQEEEFISQPWAVKVDMLKACSPCGSLPLTNARIVQVDLLNLYGFVVCFWSLAASAMIFSIWSASRGRRSLRSL